MRTTLSQLRRIVREETAASLREGPRSPGRLSRGEVESAASRSRSTAARGRPVDADGIHGHLQASRKALRLALELAEARSLEELDRSMYDDLIEIDTLLTRVLSRAAAL